MNSFPVILVGCLVFVAMVAAVPLAEHEWAAFKARHGKSYASSREDSVRRALLAKSKEQVERFNEERSRAAGFTMGLNHLSDWTESELARLHGARRHSSQHLRKPPASLLERLANGTRSYPAELDYRKEGNRVTSVKDQGELWGPVEGV